MININVFYNNQEHIVGFEVKGHAMGANRADKYDLICCAVSVLSITTVNGITDFLKVQPKELAVEDGYLKMILPVDGDGIPTFDEGIKSQVEVLLVSMVMGLEQVTNDYCRYVQLIKRRWTS